MGARGTRGHHRMVRPLEPVADRDLARDEVDESARNEEGRDPLRPPLLDQDRRLRDRCQPADPGPDHHAGAQPAFLVRGRPAGILNRLIRGGHAVEDEIIDLAPVLRLHPVVGVEGSVRAVPIRDFAGIGCHHIRRVEPRDRSGARLPGYQPLPGLLDPARKRRDHAQSGDDDAPHSPPQSCFDPGFDTRHRTGRARPVPLPGGSSPLRGIRRHGQDRAAPPSAPPSARPCD